MDFNNCFFIYSDEDTPTDDNKDTKKKKKHKKHKKDTTPSGNRYVH